MGPQITFASHEISNANVYRALREMPQGTVKQALLIPHSIMTKIFLTDYLQNSIEYRTADNVTFTDARKI
jgi:hypothetical protein